MTDIPELAKIITHILHSVDSLFLTAPNPWLEYYYIYQGDIPVYESLCL